MIWLFLGLLLMATQKLTAKWKNVNNWYIENSFIFHCVSSDLKRLCNNILARKEFMSFGAINLTLQTETGMRKWAFVFQR